MQNKILHPIILKLYLLRNEVFYLEKFLESFGEADNWPSGIYENVLICTDRFYRTRDRAVKIIGSETEVDCCIYVLDKSFGET